jgi:FkbM family methyltransferase
VTATDTRPDVAPARYRLLVTPEQLDREPGLLVSLRAELSEADPVELAIAASRGGPEAAAVEERLRRLDFWVKGAPHVVFDGVSAQAGDPVALASPPRSLLCELRCRTSLLGESDLSLLTQLAEVPSVAFGGDVGSIRALVAGTRATGVPLEVAAVPERLAHELGLGVEAAGDSDTLWARLPYGTSFAFLDPELPEASGILVGLANRLVPGDRVVLPRTLRGGTLARNAVASGLFELDRCGERLVVLSSVRGWRAPEPLPAVERAARDEVAMRVLTERLLSPGSCCVDVGAYNGGYLRLLRSAAPRGRHLAFEPMPRFAALLREEFPDVAVHQLALADTPGPAAFVHVCSNEAFSGLLRRPYPREEEELELIRVETARLDDLLPAGYAPSLVKIDTEGAEGLVLRGAVETLARHRPAVFLEHGLPAALSYGVGSSDIWDLLCGQAGLELYDLDGGGPYSRADFAGPKPFWNFLALPADVARPSLWTGLGAAR